MLMKSNAAILLILLLLPGCVWSSRPALDETTRQDIGPGMRKDLGDGCTEVISKLPDNRYERELIGKNCEKKQKSIILIRRIGDHGGEPIYLWQTELEFNRYTKEPGYLIGITRVVDGDYQLFDFRLNTHANYRTTPWWRFWECNCDRVSEIERLAWKHGLSLVDTGAGDYPVIVGEPKLEAIERFFLEALALDYVIVLPQ